MTWSCRTSQLRKLLETSSYILPPLQMVWRILIASLNFKASLGWHHSNTSFSQFTAKLKETLAWNRRLPSKSLCPKYRGCPPLLFSLNQVWDVSIWGSRIENELIMPKFWLPYIILYQIALLTGPTDPKNCFPEQRRQTFAPNGFEPIDLGRTKLSDYQLNIIF